eukprot:758840-Hanusia_phi.AAC.2
MWSPSDMCYDPHHKDFSSLDMLKLIFPTSYSMLSTHISSLLGVSVTDLLFPPWTIQQCPEIRWEFILQEEQKLYVRNPTLLAIQLFGIVVGTFGAYHWYRGRRREEREGSAWCLSWHWMFSFLWFAAMNASSVMVRRVCRELALPDSLSPGSLPL